MGTGRGVCGSLVVVVPLGWGACAESISHSFLVTVRPPVLWDQKGLELRGGGGARWGWGR